MKNVMIYKKHIFTNFNKPDDAPIGLKHVAVYKIRNLCFAIKSLCYTLFLY